MADEVDGETTGSSWSRPILGGVMLALVIGVAAVLIFGTFAARDPFLARLVALASETFSADVPVDRLAGYGVDDICLIPAGADPRAIAATGGMPVSALINVSVAEGEIGLLMHGEGQTTFATLPGSAWSDNAALAHCFAGGGFTLAFDTAEPLRGGRLLLPGARPGGNDGIEAGPLAPLPR